MSGIFRDVYLWAAAQQHIRDFEVHTDLDSEYRDANSSEGDWHSAQSGKVTVTAALFDAAGAGAARRRKKSKPERQRPLRSCRLQ